MSTYVDAIDSEDDTVVPTTTIDLTRDDTPPPPRTVASPRPATPLPPHSRRMNTIRYVNSCFRGDVRNRINLQDLHNRMQGSRLKLHDPVMLIYKFGQLTLMVFSTGKFRFMGPFMPTEYVACRNLRTMPDIPQSISRARLVLQSITVTFKLPGNGVNLPKLARELRRDGERFKFVKREFQAISLYRWDPLHVNIFYSGRVVIVGGRYNMQRAEFIQQHLIQYINSRQCWTEYTGRKWMQG